MKLCPITLCCALLFSPVMSSAIAAPQDAGGVQTAGAGQKVLGDRMLPMPVFRWDCGDCARNDKVFPMIEAMYAAEAAAAGYNISESETVEVVFTAYRQRSAATRVMLGFVTSNDALATRITFRGKALVDNEYPAKSLAGLDSLSTAVSKKLVDHVIAGVKPQ